MEVKTFSKVLAHQNNLGSRATRDIVFVDEDIVASCGYDFLIKIWNLKALISGGADALLQTLQGHKENVRHLYYNKDHKFLLSGSNDCTAIIWKQHRRPLRNEKGSADIFYKFKTIYGFQKQVWSALYIPKFGLQIIGHNNYIYIYGKLKSDFKIVRKIAAENGKYLMDNVIYDLVAMRTQTEVLACGRGKIYLFDIIKGSCVKSIQLHNSFIYRMSEINFNGTQSVVTLSEDETWTVFDITEFKEIYRGSSKYPVCSIALAKELNLLVLGFSNGITKKGYISFFDSTNLTPIKTISNSHYDSNGLEIPLQMGGTLSLLWSSKYKTLLSGHWDGFIRSYGL